MKTIFLKKILIVIHQLLGIIKKQICKPIYQQILKQILWLLRSLIRDKKHRKRRIISANSGFVLPTVAMVSVVVVLLTTSIMLRSFDRAKNATNIRINQAVLSSATPAIDRGRAKINQLFNDKNIPKNIPTDEILYNAINNNIEKYTFGDETPLQITFDINKNKKIDEPTSSTKIYNNETLRTAWRFPVDTNNNGKFDSYNIYGIYFRTPSVDSSGKYTRSRNPLEARTLPMSSGTLSAKCSSNTSTTLVGNTGWVKHNYELQKSFFVYTAIVPITSTPTDTTNYEKYQGNKGFAAVEYQQDRVQVPPNNHAVVYEDDISLTPQANFHLNGAIFTNSNFLTSNIQGGAVRFYQVSSPSSCFYEAHNAKITVGGNIALGGFTSTKTEGNSTVDLFKGQNTNISSVSWNNSINSENTPANIAYNNLAYVNRINQLINAQIINSENTDPSEVTTGLAAKEQALGITLTGLDRTKYRRQQLEIYFKRRTRKVPYKEVGFNDIDTIPNPIIQGIGDTLRANDQWIYPTDPSDGKNATDYSKLTLNITGTSLQPKATEPRTLQDSGRVEGLLGDRVLLANNLPELWWDKTKAAFVGSGINDTQEISGIKWDAGNTSKTRTRRSLVQTLTDIGSTDRDGEWELAAAKVPSEPSDGVGGLRVITGAGIYLPNLVNPSTFSNNNTTNKIIWPDNNPVPQAPAPSNKIITPYALYGLNIQYQWRDIPANTPFLQMRAAAVYHYKSTGYNQQTPKPIACVSSFYVPTNRTTASNHSSLPNAAGIEKNINGLSNNGIVYPAPTKTVNDYAAVLLYQSQLTYPNGRLIDDGLLAKALAKTSANRTIAEQSAIDAQICALQIKYDSSFQPITTNPIIPHGAIREISFLDPREVQQNSIISASGISQSYDMPVKDRQPLEIRATVLDINLLRSTSLGGTPTEYLLPNSGIIYATRDDALPDMSADITNLPLTSTNNIPSEANKLVSPVDYKLDPTRRPQAIMLINGSKIWRSLTYRAEEKGLILATNLPVYIKGNFNLHSQEEFTETLTDNWSNFYSRTNLNHNFACRVGDPKFSACTTGDEWRPATVLSDTVTLLSANFREGFREEGEYDWNYTLVGTAPPGFSQSNSYAPLGTWADTSSTNAGFPRDFDSTITGYQGSSYLNNFVTPLVRWIPAREYGYEVCNSTNKDDCFCNSTDTAAQCTVKNKRWVITNVTQKAYKDNGQNSWRNDGGNIEGQPINSLKTGALGNANAPSNGWEELPFKRIAFKRDTNTAELISPLSVYGVDSTGKLRAFEFGSATLPKLAQDSNGNSFLIPWLTPDSNGVWQPVLQISRPFATDTDPNNNSYVSETQHKNWLQIADADTTFNMIIATGDSPARSSNEDNGGLPNLVRFMQIWTGKKAKISGSFMQIKKSSYGTGPFTTSLISSDSNLLYAININSGKGTGYLPPTRIWGYDVGLLSQEPDLFASKLILTPPDLPNEYFREVSRDDTWIQQLLCAKDTTIAANYAIDKDQRPSMCQS